MQTNLFDNVPLVSADPHYAPYVTFYEFSEYGGLMTAVGCRKSAIFDRGSNL